MAPRRKPDRRPAADPGSSELRSSPGPARRPDWLDFARNGFTLAFAEALSGLSKPRRMWAARVALARYSDRPVAFVPGLGVGLGYGHLGGNRIHGRDGEFRLGLFRHLELPGVGVVVLARRVASKLDLADVILDGKPEFPDFPLFPPEAPAPCRSGTGKYAGLTVLRPAAEG